MDISEPSEDVDALAQRHGVRLKYYKCVASRSSQTESLRVPLFTLSTLGPTLPTRTALQAAFGVLSKISVA